MALFLLIAFAFSWAQWLAAMPSVQQWIGIRVPLTPFGSFGPAIAALVVLRAKGWWRSIGRWRMPAFSFIAACFTLPITAVVCFFIAARLSGDVTSPSFPPLVLIAAAAAQILILGGPLGEEPGWRGYLLPELRKSMGPLLATLVVAAVWLAWHLPLYWVPGSAQQEIPSPKFALALLAYSFVMTWLVERSGGSTLAAILFHTSANVTFWLAAVAIKSKAQDHAFWPAYLAALAVLGVASAIALFLTGSGRDVRPPWSGT